MRIGQVARMAGVTVRTLRYYDEIGLLKPREITDTGYRLYSEAEIDTLQQILFLRDLEFPLETIRVIIQDPSHDQKEVLRQHRSLLVQKRDRLNSLIALLDRTLEGEQTMRLDQMNATDSKEKEHGYTKEAKKRWGGTAAYTEYQKRAAGRSDSEQRRLSNKGSDILREFAAQRSLPPDSAKAQALVSKWKTHITDSYYTCTKEILSELAQMYVGDERFMRNIDQFGEGTAAFMAAAINVYVR